MPTSCSKFTPGKKRKKFCESCGRTTHAHGAADVRQNVARQIAASVPTPHPRSPLYVIPGGRS